jgi:hypothetical protein
LGVGPSGRRGDADRRLSADVHLNTQRDYQRVIVVASRDDGVTLDITRDAVVRLSAEGVARWTTRAVPGGRRRRKLVAEYQGHQAEATIAVVDATADRPISFHLDVMPVLMRAGCNTGSCHGSARGKDGFGLSLFGFDPVGDHYRVSPAKKALAASTWLGPKRVC